MSDYSQITFFTPKDGLATGNPNKIIYGSDVDAELSAISTAITSKADVDGDAIGAGTPATELSVDNLKLDANKIISTNTDGDIELEPNGAGYVVITNVDVAAGEIDGTTIGANSAAAGTFTTANATTVDTTNLEVTNLKAKDGTAAGSIANSTGVVTLASSVLTTTDVNGGTIDGAIIGGATPAAITGTTLKANTSLELATGATVTAILDEDTMTSDSATALATQQSIKAYVDAQVTAQDLDVTTDSGTIAIDLDSETLTVAGGTGLDTSATGNTVTVAIDSTVATLTGAQTLTNKTLTSPDINTPDIDGGTIDGATIATSDVTVGAGKTLDVSAGTLTLANDQISGDKIEGGTIGSVTITTADINGGTIDGVTIGGSSAGAITGTTGTFSGNLAVDTNTLFVDAANNRVGIGTSSPTKDLDIVSSGSPEVNLRSTSAGSPYLNITPAGGGQGVIRTTTGQLLVGSDDSNVIINAGGSERMRIDSSGNVGIGTTSPDSTLHVLASSAGAVTALSGTTLTVERDNNNYITLLTGDADVNALVFGTPSNNNNASINGYYNGGSQYLNFNIAGSERMRIDSNGDVFIGKTSTAGAGAGIVLEGEGRGAFTRDDDIPLQVRRETSDGDLIEFRKDTTTVGSIGSKNGDLDIGTGNTAIRFNNGLGSIFPVTAVSGGGNDAAVDIGYSTIRFKDIYRSGSTISTSDRNMKQDERSLTDAEAAVAQACKGLLKAFRFIDAVEKDGDGARIHFGIVAQDLQAAFEAEGLDATSYAMFRPSTFTDDEGNEQTRLGVCYENLLAFIIAAL